MLVELKTWFQLPRGQRKKLLTKQLGRQLQVGDQVKNNPGSTPGHCENNPKLGRAALNQLQWWTICPSMPPSSRSASREPWAPGGTWLYQKAQQGQIFWTDVLIGTLICRKGWKIMTEDGETLDSNALKTVVGMIKEIEYQVNIWQTFWNNYKRSVYS